MNHVGPDRDRPRPDRRLPHARSPAPSGILLILLFYLCNPPFVGYFYSIPTEGSYLIVNKNLVEVAGARRGRSLTTAASSPGSTGSSTASSAAAAPVTADARAPKERQAHETTRQIDIPGLTRRDVLKTASLASIAAAFPGRAVGRGRLREDPRRPDRLRRPRHRRRGRLRARRARRRDRRPWATLFPDRLRRRRSSELNEKLPGRVTGDAGRPASPASTPTRRCSPADVDLRHPGRRRRASARCTSRRRSRPASTSSPRSRSPSTAAGVRAVLAAGEEAEAEEPGDRRRHAAPAPGRLRRDDEAHPRRRHRRDRRRPACYWNRAALWVEPADRSKPELDRHGVADPQLVLLHLAVAATTSSSSTSTTST